MATHGRPPTTCHAGNIVVNGGGTVLFHVAPYFPGEVGSYLLQLDINSATVGIGWLIGEHHLHPNPAKDRFTIVRAIW